jgi:hypothetical protein
MAPGGDWRGCKAKKDRSENSGGKDSQAARSEEGMQREPNAEKPVSDTKLQGRWVFHGIDADGAHRPPPGAGWNAASYYRLCFEDHILKSAVEPQHPSAKRERLNTRSRRASAWVSLCELSQP